MKFKMTTPEHGVTGKASDGGWPNRRTPVSD